MWFPEECDNADSCRDGSRHLYPYPDTLVQVLESNEWRLVGSDKTIVVPCGTYKVGDHVDYPGHQASVIVGDVLVWIDIEELHGEGWQLLAPGALGRATP
jgi:hypothetical protein